MGLKHTIESSRAVLWQSAAAIVLTLIGAAAGAGVGGVSGCSNQQGTLSGKVLDLFGNPVSARVQIAGQDLHVTAGADGVYRLPYVPGKFEVRFTARGHVPESVRWDLYRASPVRAAPVVLVPYPPGPGLWYPGAETYRPLRDKAVHIRVNSVLGLSTGTVRRRVLSGPPLVWCTGRPLVLVATSDALASSVRAWRVGADGVMREAENGVPEPVPDLEVQRKASRLMVIDAGSTGRMALRADVGAGGWNVERVFDLVHRACRGADQGGVPLESR